jgi:hypothetical protein
MKPSIRTTTTATISLPDFLSMIREKLGGELPKGNVSRIEVLPPNHAKSDSSTVEVEFQSAEEEAGSD